MHSRFPAGWRFTLRTALTATLILLPFAAAIAEAPESMIDHGTAGLQAVEGQQDGISSRAKYARANYVWPFAVGPFYGEVDRATYQTPGVVFTNVGSFDLTLGDLNIPGPLKSPVKLSSHPAQYFVIALDPTAGEAGLELRETIAAHGGAVVQSLPVASMVVRLTPGAMSAIQGFSEVLAVSPYHAAFKLDPTIGRVPLNDPVRAISEVYSLDVRIFKGENAELVAQQLVQMGGNVVSIYPNMIRVEIHRTKLADVASLEPVQQINENLPIYPHAEETTTTVQTGQWNAGATPYHDAGIDGTGQVMMMLDSGIQLDAGDLSDTRTDAGSAGSGHRKVLRYQTTNVYGGSGDLLGCDATAQGGFTHGQLVAATALGNGTKVAPAYGTGWTALDESGNPWNLDGLAPGAKLVAFDAQLTPPSVSCADPLQDTFFVGNLYTSPSAGSLGDSYTNDDARIFNFSWGADNNAYTSNSIDVDDFLFDKRNAMVFISAGNAGDDADSDGIPDLSTLGTPATTKNGLAIGASRVANDLGAGGQQQDRATFSSTGPAADTNVVSGRVAPQLMAPGDENADGQGLASEFGCRSNDNDQTNPVECDWISGVEGTSFASPAAAGAAILVRDYFAQGFYPDGTSSNPGNVGDQVADISGALIKSILIASADFLDRFNVTYEFRFNNEQGYGRINLSNALPLQNWPASATGLAVADGGIVGGVSNLSGLDGVVNAVTGDVDTETFEVCDAEGELRVALSWLEDSGTTLTNNLNLTLQSPSGKLYWGNYFTDDNNRNKLLDAGEDCPGVDGTTGELDNAAWSLPICGNSDRDLWNPTEAIMLSPDYNEDNDTDLDPDDDNQIEIGTWTISVQAVASGSGDPAQRYAVAIAGGVCLGSSVRFDNGVYGCNSVSTITVNEVPETGDLTPDLATVAARTTVEVLDPLGTVMDTELGTALGFTQPDVASLNFVADNVILTDGTAYDPGNGVLDVRTGDTVRVVYRDVDAAGLPDADKVRASSAQVDCNVRVAFGDLTFGQFGQDSSYLVLGGCERNERGLFEFGYPDRYMDADESVSYRFAFASAEYEDMNNVEVNLRCVITDDDSPEDCKPNSSDCPDPNRENNTTCDGTVGGDPVYMTILDTPKLIGLIPAGAGLSSNFSIQMPAAIPPDPDNEVDMILEVVSRTSGKTTSGLAINRHLLDVDENSVFYSTDFPGGGTEFKDRNNNEILENPTTNIGDFLMDYRFETRTWSDLTAGGTKNSGLSSPWNFDSNRGNFTSGLGATTDESTIADIIAQWGEDKNFNNVPDGFCNLDTSVGCQTKNDCIFASAGTVCNPLEDRDPVNLTLDYAWGSLGGCGWQTKASPGDATGSIWHTGNIKATTSGNCMFNGNLPGQCQYFETVSGATGQRQWFEILVTPEIQKVNGDDFKVEITDWAWNQAADLPDSNVYWTWELDTDTKKLEPVDLKADLTILNFGNGGYGPVTNQSNPDLTNGFTVFAPVQGTCFIGGGVCAQSSDCSLTCNNGGACETDADCLGGGLCDNCRNASDVNGTLGNNREGQNSCFFRGTAGIAPPAFAVLGFAGPDDDDLDNDLDGTIDEYVTTNGPVRNMDLYAFNGPDMRFSTLEDIFGDTGEWFQAGVGMLNVEKADGDAADPVSGYGIGIDDMVVEWREFNLLADTTVCAGFGECAVLDMATSNLFEGNTLITITVLEKTPPADNDCDFDDTPDGTTDCDGDTVRDVPVKVTSQAEIAGEFVACNLVAGTTDQFTADLPVSNLYDVEGVLFVAPEGTDAPQATGLYMDNDDGTGQICKNDVDPAAQGRVEATTTIGVTVAEVVISGYALSDNGDNDGWADSNETVQMQIKLANNTLVDLAGLKVRLSTNDPKVECITGTSIDFGDLLALESKLSVGFFEFKIADVSRPGTVLDDFSATFNVIVAGDDFDATVAAQEVKLDLDLNASGGSGPGEYAEGFESGGFGTFTTMNLDAGRNSEAQSEGFRCQYSDPDWFKSNSYGEITDCWLGATGPQLDRYYWDVYDTLAPSDPVGRSKSGRFAASMGYWKDSSSVWTTQLAILEAFSSNNPINIAWDRVCENDRTIACTGDGDCSGVGGACVGVTPELSFWLQADFMDGRVVNTPPNTSGDGAVVQIQLADTGGNPVGDWVKLEPYSNVYDQPRTDNYTNCFFDPVDDGNTEDDFFDPSDPERRLGPSSFCFPEKSFVFMGTAGETFNIGNASIPPTEADIAGFTGIGTWVQSRFVLSGYRGRSVRIRFLNGSLKAGGFEDVDAIFPDLLQANADDGMWVDEILITDTLSTPASLSVDTTDNSGLPACAPNCTVATASMTADPAVELPAPGQVVELDASSSTANSCLAGTLQYQFSANGTLVRSWTDNPVLIVAPELTTTYTVDVRCSTATTCVDSLDLIVPVNCPASGNLGANMLISAPSSKTAYDFDASYSYHFCEGADTNLASYTCNALNFPATAGPATSHTMVLGTPPAGSFFWTLFRTSGSLGAGTYCNDPGNSWGSTARDAVLP